MISVHNLRKVFEAGNREIVAVDGISFSVSPGEVYGLLGPNGAGKTTTLRMILGLLKPTSGYAEVHGYSSSADPDQVKRQIGFVSAGAGLYQWLTPEELLLFFADVYGRSPDEAAEQLEQLSKLLEMDSFLKRRCATLSTGQRQRVNLARAMIHNPPVMLLDEPTKGLDVVGSQVVFDYVQSLREMGKSVIVSTHRLDEAQRLCQQFGVLHQGRLALDGSLQSLQEKTGCATLTEIFLQLIRRQAVKPS